MFLRDAVDDMSCGFPGTNVEEISFASFGIFRAFVRTEWMLFDPTQTRGRFFANAVTEVDSCTSSRRRTLIEIALRPCSEPRGKTNGDPALSFPAVW